MRNPFTSLSGIGALISAVAAAVACAAGYVEQVTPFLLSLSAALSGLAGVFAKDAPEGP
jgi:ABC-type uncharacterized transport system permease subunit